MPMMEKRLADLDGRQRPVLDDLSVVIPTLGRPILEQCLQSIAAAEDWPGRLIVVDQSHSPQVEAWMGRLGELGIETEYVSSAQHGRSAGINRGLERVTTRFVAITDDDCLVAPDWMRRVTERLRAEPGIIITGRVELAGNDEVAFSVVTSQTPRVYLRPELKVHPLIGANMGVSMRNVECIGPFDEHPSIACAEDSDWGHRALRAGIPIAYDPRILVLHYHWRDAGQRAKQYDAYSRSIGGFYGKFLLGGDGMIWLQTLRDLVRAPIRWVRGIVKGDSDMTDRGRSDTVELPPGILAGLRRRRDVPGPGDWPTGTESKTVAASTSRD
jgi:GT2 family glycosyltransferase